MAIKVIYNYCGTFILVINQLDAQNFCFTISLFHASTYFEQHVLLKLNRQILHKVNNKKTNKNYKKNLDYIYLPQPKDQKNYQFVQKYRYRHTTTLHHLIKPIAPTRLQEHEKKWNIQNYVQNLPQSLCRADQSQLKIKIPVTHTVH